MNKITTKVTPPTPVRICNLKQGQLANLDGQIVLRTATGLVRLSDGDTWTFGKGGSLVGDLSVFSKTTANYEGPDINAQPFKKGDTITLSVTE